MAFERDPDAPKPRLVQTPGQEVDVKAEGDKFPSVRAQFLPAPHDGIWTPEDQEKHANPASYETQVDAFREFVKRPDIESRESILARESALPGQFTDRNVESGDVVDGKVGVDAPGFGVEDEQAQKEARTTKNKTADKKAEGE